MMAGGWHERDRSTEDGPVLFDRDTTARWSCRSGDYVVWARFLGMGATQGRGYSIADFWEMRDGDVVTLTNRVADLPTGFELHPLEVSGTLLSEMLKRLADGYCPGEPMDGPSIWRVRAGDRLAWMGSPRPGLSGDHDVLNITTFRTDSLVYGEPLSMAEGWPTFGAPSEPLSIDGRRRCQAGFEAILNAGLPREAAIDPQWRLA